MSDDDARKLHVELIGWEEVLRPLPPAICAECAELRHHLHIATQREARTSVENARLTAEVMRLERDNAAEKAINALYCRGLDVD